MPGHVFVISGPSGVGKSTILELVRERVQDLEYSISFTTRRPREGEVEGVHYRFTSKEEFSRMVQSNAFVEWAEVYGCLYGTSYEELRRQIDRGSDVIMDVDVQGAWNIKNRIKEATLIYVLPPSLRDLEERLRKRASDRREIIEERFKKACGEIKNCLRYDYVIINDSLAQAVRELESVIVSRRCLTRNRLPRIEEILGENKDPRVDLG